MGLIINLAKMAKRTLKSFTDKAIKVFNRKINKVIPKLRINTKQILREEFFLSPEYEALIAGPLDGDFGFPRGTSAAIVGAIIDRFVDSLSIQLDTFRATGKTISGSLSFKAIVSDYSDILNSNEAIILTEKGEAIPWLEWLLTEGNTIVIYDYRVKAMSSGRSGKAIMVEKGNFRVSPLYSGTEQNNWVTRVVNKANIRILKLIKETVRDF